MTPPAWPDLIYANLRRGRDGARTLGDLAEAMDCPRRVVEAAVQDLRLRGFPVATGREGVWLEETSAGMLEQYRALRARALHQFRTAAAVKRTALRLRDHEQNYEQEILFVDLDSAA